MGSQNLQEWFYVEITLKDKTTGASTSYKFSQRPIIDDSTVYIPILKEIPGLGGRVDQYLPAPATGSIILNDARGSFGFERRFSDLLQRYSIIDQTVKIYAAETEYNDENVSSDFTIVRTAKIARGKSDRKAQEITLSITSTPIEAKYVTRTVDSVNFPNAPLQSLGKTLPVILGSSQEVQAVRIAADADTSPEFAYGVTLGATFPLGGVQAYYMKEKVSGKYLQVQSASAAATPVISQTSAGGIATSTGAAYEEFANPISSGYVLTGGRVKFVGINNVGWTPDADSKLFFNVYKLSPLTGLPDQRVGSATRLKSSYQASFRGASDFYVEFTFSEPVPCNSPDGYVLGIAQSVNTTGGLGSGDGVQWRTDGTNLAYRYYLYNGAISQGGTTKNWAKASVARVDTDPVYDLYGVQFADTPSSAANATDGLGYGSFELTQNTGLSSDYGNPDLTKLDFIVAVNGLKDDGSGTITGVASTLLTQMKHVVNVLMRTWNGSAWIAGPFDASENSATHNTYVTIRGATTGRTTLDQILKNLCKNTGSRLAPVGSTTEKIGVWMWGATQTTAAIFTNENSEILNYEQRGVESIVNAFTFYYDRRLRDLDIVSGSAEGQFRNFAGTLNSYPDKNALTTYLAGLSKTIFGVRPLLDVTYELIADSTSAQWLEQFILATGGMPGDYVELECDFMQYRSLKLLQVVEILSPELPGFFGTSPKAKNPTNNGVEIDLMNGDYWMRADRARAQIESLQMISRRRGSSKLRLGCRLLTNFPRDPT